MDYQPGLNERVALEELSTAAADGRALITTFCTPTYT